MKSFFYRTGSVAFLLMFPQTSDAFFPGFNVGIQVGGVQLSGKHVFVDASGNSGTGRPSAKSYMAGANLGYIFEMGQGAFKILLGAEGFFNKCGASASANLTTDAGVGQGKFNIKQTDAKGASLIVGALVNPRVALYGRFGMETSKFQLNYQDLSFATANKNVKYQKSYSALVPGVGGALLLSPKLYVALDYSFPIYKKLVIRSNGDLIDGAKVNMTYRPSEHRVLLRLAFRTGG